MRRPVRTMTEPPTPSRRIRLGDPTSSAPGGVMVAALRPRPVALIAVGGVVDDAVVRAPSFGEGQVEADQVDVDADDSGIEHPQGLVEQFLAGLVPLAHDDLGRGGHVRVWHVSGFRPSVPSVPSVRAAASVQAPRPPPLDLVACQQASIR